MFKYTYYLFALLNRSNDNYLQSFQALTFTSYFFNIIFNDYMIHLCRNTISMTKNHPSTLNSGEELNQRPGHHTHVTLAMNDFLVLRSLPFSFMHYVLFTTYSTMLFLQLIPWYILSCRFSLIQRYTIKTSRPLYLL